MNDNNVYGIIYLARSKTSGKGYSGQTINGLEERKRQHISRSKTSMFPVHSALRKYGQDDFIWEILCECFSQEELNEKEKYFADMLNTWVPYGYNLKAGNGRGSVSEEARKKMSEAHKGLQAGENHPMFGKPRSEETRKRISEKTRGRKLSEEHIQRRSASQRGHIVSQTARNKIADKVSKTYAFVSPMGESISITNIRKFCLIEFPELGLSPISMCALGRGKINYHKGWTRDGVYTINRRLSGKIYHLISPSGEIVTTDDLPQLCSTIEGLDYRSLWAVCSGKRKSHKGWTKNHIEESKGGGI